MMAQTCPRKQYIVTGTFNSPDLFVLSYDPLLPSASTPSTSVGEHGALQIEHTIRGEGPHQYLALGVSSTRQQTVYATTWGSPSALSSWSVSATPDDACMLTSGNRKEITATGSYVHVQPPAYWTNSSPGFGSVAGVGRWLGSAGGPTGELHVLDAKTGLIGDKVKELIFLDGGEGEGSKEEQLEKADKSRKALRYGAHSFDCSPNTIVFPTRDEQGAADQDGQQEQEREQEQVAFVADLGANAVQAYSFPRLDHLYTIPSVESNDGPRHSIPHPHHPLVFTVTEHTNYVDVYQVPPYSHTPPPSSSSALGKDGSVTKHLFRADMLTPPLHHSTEEVHRHEYRGDTLRFSTTLSHVFATTRGKTSATRGLLIAYRLSILPPSTTVASDSYQVTLTEVARYTTRTSGGKANAIELSAYTPNLLVLTDDEQGYIDILHFNTDTEQFTLKASTQLPPLPHNKDDHSQSQPEPQGASHAIWLL